MRSHTALTYVHFLEGVGFGSPRFFAGLRLEHQGHVIDRKRITVNNRFWETIKVVEYWLADAMEVAA